MYRSILTLLLIGCAADNTPDPPVVSAPPIVEPQRPAPTEDTSKESDGVTCIIVRSVAGGGCILNVIECSDGTEKLDGKCYPGYTLPWKNIPDPPYRK